MKRSGVENRAANVRRVPEDDAPDGQRQRQKLGVQLYCQCPVINCGVRFTDHKTFHRHLIVAHRLTSDDDKVKEMILSYSTDYFLFDSNVRDDTKFAHVCVLCCRKAGSGDWSDKKTTFEENEAHIISHLGTAQYYCSQCDLWFMTLALAGTHNKRKHSNSKPVSVEDYFEGHVNRDWLTFSSFLKKQFTESMRHNDRCATQTIASKPVEDTEFIRTLDILSTDIVTLNDLRGSVSRVFKVAGNWPKFGTCIQISTEQEISVAFEELKSEVGDLIFHHTASLSMATLLLRSNVQWWQYFINLLTKDEIRRKTYTSNSASQLFRRLMFAKSLPTVRLTSLVKLFCKNGEFDEDLLSCPFSNLFFAGFAYRKSIAARALCKYAVGRICVMATNENNEAIRRLIKTAASQYGQEGAEEYTLFIDECSSRVPDMLLSDKGLFVVQALLYQPKSKDCLKYVQMFSSVEWIFGNTNGQFNYDLPLRCHLIQTAIQSANHDHCCNLAWSLGKNSCYERLLKSKVGNNILRVLIKQIGDPATADFVYGQIDGIFNKIRFQNPHSLLPFMNLILEKAKHRYYCLVNEENNIHS